MDTNENTNDTLLQTKEVGFQDFVNSLFDFARSSKLSGLYIQREDGHRTLISICSVDNKIIIKMDDVEMGYFEEMTQRGYKCAFHQKYRTHIKDGQNPNEAMMTAICPNDKVLFYDA